MNKKVYIKVLQYLAMVFVIMIIIFPIYWIVSSSFRYQSDFFSKNPSLIGTEFTLDNYRTVFTQSGFGRAIINSLIYTIATVIISMVIASLASYALSYYKGFRLGKAITAYLYVFQMLPTLMMTIVLFLVYWKLGVLNTYTSMILAYSCGGGGTAMAVIMLCGYYEDVPLDLFEAAFIDGASPIKAFLKILLPLATPGLFCSAIYIFIVTWQEFPYAQNLITDNTMYNVTVGLASFSKERGRDWGAVMAASTMIMVPTLLMFVAIQNYFIDNLSGAVKE